MKVACVLATLALGLATSAMAAPQTKRAQTRTAAHPAETKGAIAKRNAATAPAPKSAAWKPTPFTEPTGNLPAGYKGENAWEVYQLLNANAAKTKKDEFETTAQYEARMANPAALMDPLRLDALYAFQISPQVKYDADSQSFKVGSEYGDDCRSKSYTSSDDGILLCEVYSHRIDAPDYEGQNSYGASATIKRIRGTDISIAISKSAMPKTIFAKKSYGSELHIAHSIAVSLEQAAELRGKKIALLAVGNITSPRLVEGRGVYSTPTIKDPYDMAISSYGIPFQPREYIFYIVETGQVLERIPT